MPLRGKDRRFTIVFTGAELRATALAVSSLLNDRVRLTSLFPGRVDLKNLLHASKALHDAQPGSPIITPPRDMNALRAMQARSKKRPAKDA